MIIWFFKIIFAIFWIFLAFVLRREWQDDFFFDFSDFPNFYRKKKGSRRYKMKEGFAWSLIVIGSLLISFTISFDYIGISLVGLLGVMLYAVGVVWQWSLLDKIQDKYIDTL